MSVQFGTHTAWSNSVHICPQTIELIIEKENVQPKLVAEIIKKDGKHFVPVYTPLGKPDVEHPTTFEPDFH